MGVILQDLRYAVRTLARTPGFSAVAVLSLALGIGANTALFSLMDVMLLRALPVKNPQNLVEFARVSPNGATMTNLPYPVLEYLRQDRSVLSDIFAINWTDPVFRFRGVSERATVHEVSGAFFPSLGVPALTGRTIGPEDSHAAVISYAFWSRQFGRDPSILGANVQLSGKPFTVAGIMPPKFVGVDRGAGMRSWAWSATRSTGPSASRNSRWCFSLCCRSRRWLLAYSTYRLGLALPRWRGRSNAKSRMSTTTQPSVRSEPCPRCFEASCGRTACSPRWQVSSLF